MERLTDIGVIKNIARRYGFTFSKGLGQNFLINPSVCPKIAEMGNARQGFGVIEIGTGFGVLTRELAARADRVVAIELDSRLIPVLEETLDGFDNVKIINADVMKTDLNAVIADNFKGLDAAVCANLPYYITSPVIMYLLESRLPVKSITVMVQKEAGNRLCAQMPSRECGAVTAAVRYFSEPEVLFNVSRGSFMPAPDVDSCVIRLNVRDNAAVSVSDEKIFFRVIKGAFSQRRKTVVNSLSSSLSVSKSIAAAAVSKAGLPDNIRAEELDLQAFARITEALGNV